MLQMKANNLHWGSRVLCSRYTPGRLERPVQQDSKDSTVAKHWCRQVVRVAHQDIQKGTVARPRCISRQLARPMR